MGIDPQEFEAMKARVALANKRRLEKLEQRPLQPPAENHDHLQGARSEPQPSPGPSLDAPGGHEAENLPKRVVRITCCRCRLQDPDNGFAKPFVDALRYLGVIPDDSAKDIEFVLRQKKVATEEEEQTEIEVFLRE